MRDYWNDPPEEPEPPECCGEMCEVTDDGIAFCPKCGKRFEREPEPLYDTLEEKEEAYGEPIAPALCPHGNEWGACDPCDHEGDIAFDAARERRMRR